LARRPIDWDRKIVEGFGGDIDVAGPNHCAVIDFGETKKTEVFEKAIDGKAKVGPHIELALLAILEHKIEPIVRQRLYRNNIQ
jgi:hypothetical protein